MHISIPMNDTMEYISAVTVSPFISKGVCKVCYVGQQANRNGTVITKEVATEMGRNLPGSPVVGYFNKETNDFGGHERELVIEDGKFSIVDITRPYGFVPTDAKVWFQKFNDEGTEHEYLVTEVYLWTKTYPEAKRVLEQGNNQSMELDQETEKGFWSKDVNSPKRIFIYNEALIEKLCILGENVEPCFEGAQFKSQFSLESSPEFQEFKATMYSMLTELQETLSKGGSQEPMENEKIVALVEEQNPETFQKKPEEEEKKAPQQEEGGEKKPAEGEEKKPEEEKKKNYNLEEVTEYTELKTQYEELQGKYSTLQSDYSALQESKNTLDTEVTALREFKLQAEHQSKQAMIDSFYMLSDEDKKDVTENMDTYSLDDIEAKLSILCVRNKVNFNLEKDVQKEENPAPQGLFNLNQAAESDNAPDWIKAIRETAKAVK